MKKKSVEFTLKAEKMDFPIEKIRSTQDAYNYARKFYFDDINIYESVFIVLLNQANNTIGYAKISQGGVNSCLVDKRIVSKYAIESLASAVILVHNHPSGCLKPSQYDDQLTKSIQACLQVFDIKLLDHIIITDDNGYYSYNDECRL